MTTPSEKTANTPPAYDPQHCEACRFLNKYCGHQLKPPPAEPSAAQPPADTPQVEKPGQGWLEWRLDHPSVPYKFETHHGDYEPQRDGTWQTVAFPNEGRNKAKRLPMKGYYSKTSLAELEEFLKEQLGEKAVPQPVKQPASAAPPKQSPKPQDEKPERRAWSLPKTADGDTLLVLPEVRDIPPALLNEKRWLIWKAEWDESKKKFKKPPRSPLTGKKIGATEKYLSDLTAFPEALAGAAKFNASGLGFVFLADDKRVAIDFDHCITDRALHSEVWNWLGQWFTNTYQEVSPSGDGIHVICLGELPGGKAVTATPLPNADSVTCECYANDRFLTFTGQRLGTILKDPADSSEAVKKLLKHLGTKEEPLAPDAEPSGHPMSKLTARKLHEANLKALREAKQGEGNALLNTTAFFAARAFTGGGLEGTEESIKLQLLDIVTKEWSKPHPIEGARETIRSGWTSGAAQPLAIREDDWPQVAETLEEFNKKFFAVRNFGGKFRVCHFDHVVLPREARRDVRRIVIPQARNDFFNGYCNQLIKVGEKDDGAAKHDDKASVWLKHRHRRTYEKVVFQPSGSIEPGELNLWDGFHFPAVKGDCSLYLAHLRDNVCQGDTEKYNWLIRWMAWQVRHPGEVGESAIVIHGLKGVGKNVAAEGFCELWGQHGMVVTSEGRVTSNFNAHLRDKCVLIADEAFFAGDPRQVRQLKGLITGGTLQIEAKGVDPVTVPNLLRFIIIGNDAHIVNATGDERRFFVLECGKEKIQNSIYFAAIKQQLNTGGYSALLFHLLDEVDLVASFDIHNPPHTKELDEQKTLSARGALGVWLEILQSGEIPGPVDLVDGTAQLNISDLLQFVGNQRRQGRRWDDLTTKHFQDFFGKVMGFKGTKSAQKGAYGEKRRYWFIPKLTECRKLCTEKNWQVAWPSNDDGEWTRWRDPDHGF